MTGTPPIYVIGLSSFALGLTLFFYFNISAFMRQFAIMRESYLMGMESRLEQWRYFSRMQKQISGLNLVSAILMALLGLNLHIGVFGVIFGGILGWFLPGILQRRARNKRLQRLNMQFVQSLTLLANGMKAGESLTQAFESTRRIIGGPMAQEFAIITGQIRLGVSPNQALSEFAERVPLSDVKMATSAMLISIKTGADLPEAFRQIGETIRNRMTVQGKINALTVQGKAQGLVAAVAPFFFGIALYFMNHDYIQVYFNTFLGNCVAAIVIVMQVAAFFVIRKIVSINI